MVTQTELLESPDITPFDFCLWGSMKSEVYKRKVDTPDQPLARILDVNNNNNELEVFHPEVFVK